ncbi:caspase family protein [Lewinella sp. LCG006]|uniref:nSTAND1 domain-containing NTPase n=1 Tax=Lewinella sp. LCG006 TaxID=3231911 RepID=UPI00346146D6
MKASTIQLPFTTSHAFIVGINDYQHLSPLSTAVNDARVLAERLADQHNFTVHTPLLNATHQSLRKLLTEDIPKLVGPDDRVLFYFAGHGIALDGEEGPNGYLVAADTRPGQENTLIPMQVLHDALTGLLCRHGLLILDCCFSGAFKWSSGFRDVIFDLPKVIYEERFWRYCKDPAWQVITSSAHDQKAVDILTNQSLGLREEGKSKHSPFAASLLKALAGDADIIPAGTGDGIITATELYAYLRNTVENATTENAKRQSPAIFNLKRHDKGEFIFLHPNHRFNLPPTPDRNPFMGLASYNEEDANLFYGRDRAIEALLQKVERNALTVVSGASGTGKSSVIKAGVLPQLRNQGYIVLPIIRPGKEPMQTLANELSDPVQQLANGPTVVVIDQYEELITQCLKQEDRQTFEQQLASWLRQYPELRIILSIRSDFEPQFESEVLVTWWQEGRYIVPAFSLEEIREIITKPAAQAVLFYEPEDLVEQLSEEVSQAPGALPLLSFTLSELYHAYLKSGRQDRSLAEEDYQQLGGVIGALRTRADAEYKALNTDEQSSMRKLMLRMVSLEGGELAGKRVYTEELQFSNTKESQRLATIADQLVNARLLSKGTDPQGRPYIEPAHDALVRAWARLWEWIKTIGEEKITLQYKLSQAVNDYYSLLKTQPHKAKNLLWNSNPRLDLLRVELAEKDNGLNAREESFVRNSVQRQTRRKRISWTIAIAVIIGLASLTSYAFTQQKEAILQAERATKEARRAEKKTQEAQDSAKVAKEQREIANFNAQAARDSAQVAREQRAFAEFQLSLSEANRMGLEAKIAYDGAYYAKALQLGFLSYSRFPGPVSNNTQQVIGQSFQQLWAKPNYFPFREMVHQGVVENMFVSDSEDLLITYTSIGKIYLWELNQRDNTSPVHTLKTPAPLIDAVFSRHGQHILLILEGGTVLLWNLETFDTIKLGSSPVRKAQFISQDTIMIYRGIDYTSNSTGHVIEYWSLGGQLERRAPYEWVVFATKEPVMLTYANDLLALRGLAGAVYEEKRIKNVQSGQISAFANQYLIHLQQTPEAQSTNQQNVIWFQRFGKQRELVLPQNASLSFTPNEQQLICTTMEEVLLYKDLNSDPVVLNSTRRLGNVADFSPDGQKAVTFMDVGGAGQSLSGPVIYKLHPDDHNDLKYGDTGVGEDHCHATFLSNHEVYVNSSDSYGGYIDMVNDRGQSFRLDSRITDPIPEREIAIHKRLRQIVNSKGVIYDFEGKVIMQLDPQERSYYWNQFLKGDRLLTISKNQQHVVKIWATLTNLEKQRKKVVYRPSPYVLSSEYRNLVFEDSVIAMKPSPDGASIAYYFQDKLIIKNELRKKSTVFYRQKAISQNDTYHHYWGEAKLLNGTFSSDGLLYKVFDLNTQKWIIMSLIADDHQFYGTAQEVLFSPTKQEVSIHYNNGEVDNYTWGQEGLLKRNWLRKIPENFDKMKYSPDGTKLVFWGSSYRSDKGLWIATESGRVTYLDQHIKAFNNQHLLLVAYYPNSINEVQTIATWSGKEVGHIQPYSVGYLSTNQPYIKQGLNLPTFTSKGTILDVSDGIEYAINGTPLKETVLQISTTGAVFKWLSPELFYTEEQRNIYHYSEEWSTIFDYKENRSLLYQKKKPQGISVSSRDHNYLLIAYDEKANLLDVRKKDFIQSYSHEDKISLVSISPTARLILTADDKRKIRLWNRKGELLWELTMDHPVKALAFHPDEKSFLTLTNAGVLQHWLTPSNIFDRYFLGASGKLKYE